MKAKKEKNYTGRVIQVTTMDIVKGDPKDCTSCPIARAITRSTRLQVSVDGTNVAIPYDAACSYRLPKAVQGFIDRFDAGQAGVKPFSFKIGRRRKSYDA